MNSLLLINVSKKIRSNGMSSTSKSLLSPTSANEDSMIYAREKSSNNPALLTPTYQRSSSALKKAAKDELNKKNYINYFFTNFNQHLISRKIFLKYLCSLHYNPVMLQPISSISSFNDSKSTHSIPNNYPFDSDNHAPLTLSTIYNKCYQLSHYDTALSSCLTNVTYHYSNYVFHFSAENG